MNRGRAGAQPYGPLGLSGREAGDRRGSSNGDRARGRGFAEDHRVQRAGRSRGGRSTW